MDASLVLVAQSTCSTLHIVVDSEGNLADRFLHLVHTDVVIQVAQDFLQRAFLGYVASNIRFLHHHCIGTTADERREDILGRLHSQVGIAEGVVLDLHLILEEALQLMVGSRRIGCYAVFGAQFLFTDVAEFLRSWGRQSESVLETILRRRVGSQEIVKSLGQTRNHDDGVVAPLVHLDKQLVEGVHLIGVAVGQQLLYVVKEQDATLGLLYVIVPLVDKSLIVHSVYHRQLRFINNLMLVEVVANHFCQCRLTSTRLTNDNRVHAQADIHYVLTRMKIGVGVNNGLQLLLHLVKANHAV